MIVVTAALAADRSLDIELVRPRVVDDAIMGVDSLGDGERGEGHAGLFVSYTHDPLLLIGEADTVMGVERNRLTMDLAASWQATGGFGVRVAMPVISDWGTQVPTLAAPGLGIGDPWVGATLGSPKLGPLRLGAAADVALPFGTQDAWRGNSSIRVVPSILADLHLGRLDINTNGAVVLREAQDTGVGLHVGMELLVNGGVGWDVWQDHARVTASVVSRVGLSSEGPGASAVEMLGGLQVRASKLILVDAWAGRGLNVGYGASDYRVGVGVSVHARRKPKVVVVAPPPPPPPPPKLRQERMEIDELADIVEPPPKPGPVALARVVDDEIVIRDPIQFELATANILPESLPTLKEVAAIMRDHPEVLQLVIEGHASEEGSYLYNYDLSMSRASAIFKELVIAGVHPDRLACRSMGEVKPVMGANGEDLAASRRVVFLITRRLVRGEAPPVYVRDIRLPWTGDAAVIPEGPPVYVEPLPEPEPPPKPKDIPSRSDFEEEDEYGDLPIKRDPTDEPEPDPDEPEDGEDEP